jgi:general secretion pathway protein J
MTGIRGKGFTLIEVLVSLSLLAFGLALTFSTLRGATGSSERAEQAAQRDERLRAVQGFLRRQLTMALPIAFEFSQQTGEATLFRASSSKIEFVANMPGYMSRGGPYLQTVSVVNGDHGLQLQFVSQLLTTEGPLEDERAPEMLLDGIADAHFSFRSVDANNKPGDWVQSWPQSSRLPPMMKLSVHFTDPRKHWPELIVPLRLATVSTDAGTAATQAPVNSGSN